MGSENDIMVFWITVSTYRCLQLVSHELRSVLLPNQSNYWSMPDKSVNPKSSSMKVLIIGAGEGIPSNLREKVICNAHTIFVGRLMSIVRTCTFRQMSLFLNCWPQGPCLYRCERVVLQFKLLRSFLLQHVVRIPVSNTFPMKVRHHFKKLSRRYREYQENLKILVAGICQSVIWAAQCGYYCIDLPGAQNVLIGWLSSISWFSSARRASSNALTLPPFTVQRQICRKQMMRHPTKMKISPTLLR